MENPLLEAPTKVEEKENVEVKELLLPEIKTEEGKSTAFQFTANLMKSITGSTSLIFPYTMWQMGLITGVTLTIFVVYVYCASSWRLIKLRDQFGTEEKDESDPNYHLDNDYTIICYHYFGKAGYWVILISTLITLWGSDMGTLILMTDFLVELPCFKSISTVKYIQRILPSVILVLCCWITCILKNPSLLAGVSSLGLFALIIAFAAVLIYGGAHYGLSYDASVLYPVSWLGILSNLGIIINAFGFMLVLFPLFNNLKTAVKPKINKLVNLSLIALSSIYAITGIILFLMFRQDPNHIQEAILQNLPRNSIGYYIVSITMVITLLGSFPLLMLPCFQILETKAVKKENRLFVTDSFRFWTRTLQVLIVAILSFFIPEFGSINAIIIVSQLLPALLHLYVFKTKHGVFRAIEDVVIIIVFSAIMVICTSFAIKDLVRKLQH